MVDLKLLTDDWQQMDSALTELDCHRQDGTLRLVDPYKWLIALTRSVWHILEYLVRRDGK